MVRNSLLVFLVALLSLSVDAQINRYAVYFVDKDTAVYEETSPNEYLSERALNRRLKQNIDVTIQDFPVDNLYVSQLRSSGIDVYFTSKWLNCAIVQTELTKLDGFSFIDSVIYLAPGEKLTKSNDRPRRPTSFTEPKKVESSTDFQLSILGADKMHNDGFKGEGMLIAVFDDGFIGVNEFTPFSHLYTNNQLIGTWDFVTNAENVYTVDDHGTKVLTGLAANYLGTDNTVIGTAPNADYMLFVTEDVRSEYRIEEYNWLLAAEFADSAGVDVINGSLGYSTFNRGAEMDYTVSDLDGKTAICTQAANIASDKGMVVVVSAGNEGSSSWKSITTPADAFDILAVGSVTSDLVRSSFSSFGPTADGRIKPDVSALGSLATIMLESGVITTGNGTSFSSPQIAGLVAGIWQANPDWTSKEVMSSIRFSSNIGANPNNDVGYGIPNYNRAVKGPQLSIDDILNDKLKAYPNPFSDNTIFVDLSSVSFKGEFLIKMIDTNGREFYRKAFSYKEKPEEVEITIDDMQSGVYFLVLEGRKFRKSVKLIKI